MRKLFSRAFAVLLASTIVFTNTSYSTFAASFDTKIANVVINDSTSITQSNTSDTTTSNDSESTLSNDVTSTESDTQKTDESTQNGTDSTTDTTDSISTDPNDSTSTETDTTTDNSLDNSSTSDSQSEVTNDTDATNGDVQSMATNDQLISSAMDANSASNEAADYIWEGITFGQSTDLNFQSTILPEKIGTQYATETQISVIDSSENAQPITKDAVVIESRGGKIANAHDGLTFYYTTLPTSKNFVLEAKVFINQFGPENGTTPSKQEAIGVMARDVLGAARQNPMIDGYEELPAASNIASTMVIANAKAHTTPLNISSYQRNGVFYPYGNAHIDYKATQFTQINKDGARTVTQDITPADDETYKSDDFFTLRLERTDDGFITTYIDAAGNEKTGSIDDADRVAVIDEENMYVGFFASRNAKVTYTDIYLSTSDANTAPCTFTPDSYALSFTNLSNLKTSSSDYTVAFRANFDGTVEIKQDDTVVEASGNVTAGEIYELPTTLTKETTDFVINYVSSQGNKTESFSVTKNEAYQKDLYVSVDGTSEGTGSIDSPLDLETAINYLSIGYTLYLREGTYGALDLASTVSGSSKGLKNLSAYNGENVIFSGNSYVKASYWNIKGISITGSNSAGLRASGNNNSFEFCTFYGNEDTGFQLGMGSDTDPLTWPENNVIRYCTSFNNVDASGINADGFAAKLGVGKGNLFDSCISFDNADDGWDLFNKLGDAKNEPVTIQNCIAYGNGNNGFKLGGEGYAVNHIISDSLAFKNNLDGFTDNFNTGVLTVTNCTSVDNNRYNYIFRLNPYTTGNEQSIFTNNISFRSNYDADTVADYISGNIVNSYFFGSENDTVTANDFISVTAPASYERNADGTINYGDYLRPTTTSFLASNGVGSSAYIGAIAPINSNPGTNPDVFVTSITLDTTAATLKAGEALSLKATVVPANATNQTINWTSSNPSVVTIDKNGLIQAVTEGTAVITAASGDGSNISATCSITVQPTSIPVTSVSINKSSTVIAKGSKESLIASIMPQNASNALVAWTSSNTKIATVDETGKVTAKTYGTATITVSSKENPSITASCKVSVGYKITYKLNKGKNNDKNPSSYYKQKITLSSPTRKGYVFKGWYTDSKFKTKITTIKKNSTKNYTLYAKWEKVSKPATPTLKSVTNIKSNKLKLALKSAVSNAKGYEVTYATNKKFTKNKNTATISKSSTLTKTISKLTKGSTYYVKVRAYKVDSDGNKVYGKYSNTLSIKIKK
jgi:pectate disaccharide-lyase